MTSLIEPTVLKLTNQYHPNEKSSLEYLKIVHLPILLCIYLTPLSKLIKSFPYVKYMYADDIEIHADCQQSSNTHLKYCLTN